MCSIGAIVLERSYDPKELRNLVINLLRRMVERGTDASGIAVIYRDGTVWLRKAPISGVVFASKISRVADWEKDAAIVLLHTRAATQGSPMINENNHPLYEVVADDLMYILVHNGVIHSDSKARKREVDSDAILQAIVTTCRENGLSLDCVDKALNEVSGTMAIAVADTRTMSVVLYRNSNPTECCYIEGLGLVCASTYSILSEAVKETGIAKYLSKSGRIKDYGSTKARTLLRIGSPITWSDVESIRTSLFSWEGYYYSKGSSGYGYHYDYGRVTYV